MKRSALLILIITSMVPMVFADMQVLVNAGDYDRIDTPVSVEVYRPNITDNAPICVERSGKKYPAQVERINSRSVRVWWIVDRLPAGEKAHYTIHFMEDCSPGMFRWKDVPGQMMDLFYEGQPQITYMYRAYDKNDVENTKKPFHHVYDPDGRRLITKGVGGLYSHHRGIFYGYRKIQVGDESFDIWHANNGEFSQHDDVVHQISGPVIGGHTVRIDWNDREGKPFIAERRTIKVFKQSVDHMLVEGISTLVSRRGTIMLDGDRQHAGFQFRAAQYVAEHQEDTRYLRPEKWKDLPTDKEINDDNHIDLPWDAIKFPIKERHYTVAYLTDPANPGGARFSERLYGRFGEFIPHELHERERYTLRYRWWIVAGEDVSRADVQRKYEELANPPSVMVTKTF